MDVPNKKWRSIVAPLDMNYDREQISPNYGYRVNKVKDNLRIEFHNPSIDWGIYNFVVSTRSEVAFPSTVLNIVRLPHLMHLVENMGNFKHHTRFEFPVSHNILYTQYTIICIGAVT